MMQELKGVGVTSGIAIGQALMLLDEDFVVYREYVEPEEVAAVLQTFEEAIVKAKEQIRHNKEAIVSKIGEEHAFIFDAHSMILDDASLKNETIKYIKLHQCNADWAFSQVLFSLVREFESLNDPFFAERAKDLEDVGKRLIKILTGDRERGFTNLKDDIIIIGSEFGPSNITTFDNPRVQGFATDLGGPTTHTAIIAKALNLPAVLGLHTVSRTVQSGDMIILDALNGKILINPDEETLANYRALKETRKEASSPFISEVKNQAKTRDNVAIQLLANIELPVEVDQAIHNGAQGIGLYRTEFLFLQFSPNFPTEEDHFNTYCQIAEKAGDRPVTIRTLDLGGEKFFHRAFIREKELNPVLGLRGVRLCLLKQDIFKVQLRGLLRACAKYPNIQIMFPLITHLQEFHMVKDLMLKILEELEQEGKKDLMLPKLGVMIEVPSAAMVADHLAEHVDFFSIGTNDLLQYFLAIDRANDDVNYLYDPFHPGLVRVLRFVIDSAAKFGIEVTCCGEMASHPKQACLLMAMGLRNLSMNPSSIPSMHHLIGKLSMEPLEKTLHDAQDFGTGKEIRYAMTDTLKNLLSDQDFETLVKNPDAQNTSSES